MRDFPPGAVFSSDMHTALRVSALLLIAGLAICPAQYRGRRGATLPPTNTGYNGPPVAMHGVVRSITKKQLLMDDDQGETQTVRITKKTKFIKDKKDVKYSDIPPGATVTLEVTKDPSNKLVAVDIEAEPTGSKTQ